MTAGGACADRRQNRAGRGGTRTLRVERGGLREGFTSIGAALEATADDDRVVVAAGTYVENLVVTKNVVVEGAGSVAVQSHGGVTLVLAAPAATLRNLHLRGGDPSEPVLRVDAGASIVESCGVTAEHADGVAVTGGDPVPRDCRVTSAGFGISVRDGAWAALRQPAPARPGATARTGSPCPPVMTSTTCSRASTS